MVDKVLLSCLRRGRYVLRAFCTKAECNSSWEVDIAQAEQTLGDILFTELRRRLRCPQMRRADLHNSHLSKVSSIG
jgi:hypothetical protein